MKFNQSFVTVGHHRVQREDTILDEMELNSLEDFIKFVEESAGDVIVKSPAFNSLGWELQIIIG